MSPLPPPSPALRACVVVPARNEEARLPHLVASLAAQRAPDGRPLAPDTVEVIVLLNNCTDGSARSLVGAMQAFPHLRLHAVETQFAPHEAHVGRARQWLVDRATERLLDVGRPDGLVLTTDADSRVPPDWIAAAEAEVVAGADAVGGRVCLDAGERAALPAGVRRLFLLDIGYRRALEELRSLLAPDAHDPFPRHHQHFGACLAVTARAVRRAGGMPLVPTSEDVALVRAVEASGGRLRHSYRFHATTSARRDGRAAGGLADALVWWTTESDAVRPVCVETADAAARRLTALGRWRRNHPGLPAPTALLSPPEPALPDDAAPIESVLRALREWTSRLQPLALDARWARVAPSPRPLSALAA